MSDQQSRQSFLGDDSETILHEIPIAVIGTSGGGSPLCQQLAHIGFGNVHIIDPAIVREHHRHRMIGVNSRVIKEGWPKVRVVKQLMDAVNPRGRVVAHPVAWQEVHEVLQGRKLVFTCVDGYQTRDEIERYLRSYGVPMIDVGMDVNKVDGNHQICGQVILSQPGSYCLRCFGYLTDELFKKEIGNYGAAGSRAQVSWPNSILASTAISVAMAKLLPWNSNLRPVPYLQYDGNLMQIRPSSRLMYLRGITCPHYSSKPTDDPVTSGPVDECRIT